MFERILVPLDGSFESNVALPLARTMAHATGGAITLLRVLTPGSDSLLGQAQEELHRITDELSAGGLDVDGIVTVGEPADEILSQLARRDADLVIMRTHGRAGLERVVMGSTTQKVLRGTNVPVLLLRPGGRQTGQIQTLLVPVDGSPGGAYALTSAVGLAKTAGAAIKLFEAVLPVAMQQWVGYSGVAYYDPAWDEEALASAKSYITSLVARLHESGLQARGEARASRKVASAIVEDAEAAGADLIVMSTHALTGVARAVIGSVADEVVRTAKCPVLLVHRVEGHVPAVSSDRASGEPLAV